MKTRIGVKDLFVTGERRLNLLWRLLLYLLSWWVVFVLSAVPATVLALLLRWPASYQNAAFAVFAIPALIGWTYVYRRWIDRRPWAGIGLTRLSAGLPQLGAGFLAGAVMVAAWLLLDSALGWVRFVGDEPTTSGPLPALGFVLVGLAANAGAGFLEEIGYRGYVLQNLGRRFPLWAAVPLSSLLFAIVVHFNKLTPFLAAVAIVVGVLLALTRLLTGTIWFAIGLHWSFDGTQTYLFGLGDMSPPYHHSLIHLQAQGYLTGVDGQDPMELAVACVAVGLGLLWLHRARRLDWGARLDDDGRPALARPER
jgi:membrane protease YdiL (CAAX protease family)